jgi:hypothetical protein
MIDWAALATFLLALATVTLAFFTFRMAQETKKVATGTEKLATAAAAQLKAANEEVRIAGEELAHLQQEARDAKEPQIVLELDDETVTQVAQGPGSPMSYAWVKVRLANYGGHAVIEPLQVTGKPKVETRPLDVTGFLPSGGRLPFRMRFDVGNAQAAPTVDAAASVPIRAKGRGLTEWKESMFYVKLRWSIGGANESQGWRAEIQQPLNLT